MSTSDCVSSSCRTGFGIANLVSGFGVSTNKRALLINSPLSQSSETVRLRVSGTLLSDVSSKLCFSGGWFKSPSSGGNGSVRIAHSKRPARNSDEFDIYRELGLKEIEKNREIRHFGSSRRNKKREELRDNSAPEIELRSRKNSGKDHSSSDFLDELDMSGKESVLKAKEDNLMKVQEGLEGGNPLSVAGRRRGKQMMKRSNIIAKQVISIQSALGLGFVSQLWVDTSSWLVLVVEVRPNLLSGELERCLLEDITKVGDVLLVEGEHAMENDFKVIGLETLVGYTVVTPGRRNIGKVRGYTFNINSGAVESLELDSFGISIIPSSLVNTYALFVDDVLAVLPDTVVVHEAAASRILKLTKFSCSMLRGFWGTQNMGVSVVDFEEYSDDGERDDAQSGCGRSNGRKFHKKMVESSNDWELPMDFL